MKTPSPSRSVPLQDAATSRAGVKALYWCSVVLSVAFGLIWIYAGVRKVMDPFLFLLDVRSFQMLVDPWAAWLALCLPWLEIMAGLCLIIRRFYMAALLVLNGLLVAFLIAIISAMMRGLDISCGCFGKSENATNYAELITRDILLLVWGSMLVLASLWLGKAAREAQLRGEHSSEPPDAAH